MSTSYEPFLDERRQAFDVPEERLPAREGLEAFKQDPIERALRRACVSTRCGLATASQIGAHCAPRAVSCGTTVDRID